LRRVAESRAEDDGVVRRIAIQTDDVAELVDKEAGDGDDDRGRALMGGHGILLPPLPAASPPLSRLYFSRRAATCAAPEVGSSIRFSSTGESSGDAGQRRIATVSRFGAVSL
jgi:hypothetical protein